MAKIPPIRFATINLCVLCCLWLAAAVEPARAGPPYVTDDPEPTETGHWENYAFVSGTRSPGETQGQAGLDLNYGAATDLQLTAVVPLDYAQHAGDRIATGDLELGVKYRFLHQSDDDWLPDVSAFPQIGLPTAGAGFGTGRVSLFLPLWLQKDLGPWSTFGGGGFELNPGVGQRDFALLGWAVTRTVTEHLTLGVELYHQTPDTVGGRALTGLGFGAVFQMTEHLALLASAGPGLQNAAQEGQAAFYASVELTY